MLNDCRNFNEEGILFESLINERIQLHKSTENIDEQIWSIYVNKMSILFTDLCGFLITTHENGIIHFIQKIYIFKSMFLQFIEKYNGQIIKIVRDSFIVLFETVEDAISTTLETQRYLLNFNKEKGESEKIFLCAGIGYGDI